MTNMKLSLEENLIELFTQEIIIVVNSNKYDSEYTIRQLITEYGLLKDNVNQELIDKIKLRISNYE